MDRGRRQGGVDKRDPWTGGRGYGQGLGMG